MAFFGKINERDGGIMWENFENQIREIACTRWSCNANTETIGGVKCDCVLHPNSEECIAVEITEENNLTKVRTDIAKLVTIRNAFLTENIFCRCYFVMKDSPTDSMRTAGKESKIRVMSGQEFQDEYFEYSKYIYNRQQRPFGSMIDADTGKPDNNTYVNVSYCEKKTGKEYSIDEIINLLKQGRKIILTGDFGLGKSRCIKQIFDILVNDYAQQLYTIAINLRDHWGAKRGTEILTRHFEELGMEAREFIQRFEKENIIYLLDGFDEIGTQAWSSDPQKMHHIREISVCGLKDLLGRIQGGAIVAGREYYFNSDEELMTCLGLDERKTLLLECHNEFTDSELLAFISSNIPGASKSEELKQLPPWLPKRPLVIQMLSKFAEDFFSSKHALDNIYGFWNAFFTKMCEREARIYPALNPKTIEKVLLHVANQTRCSSNNTGPITLSDLSNAFVEATGVTPSDESAIMLQRLPSLGRISADSPDRQFLDGFVLNGLRAEAIIRQTQSYDKSSKLMRETWQHPLDQTGLSILSEYISEDRKHSDTFLSVARDASHGTNRMLAADIVSALCMLDTDHLDFRGIHISEAEFSFLTFEGKAIQRLSIYASLIEKLDLTNSKLLDEVEIKGCMIGKVHGVASGKGLPSQIGADNKIDAFERLATTTLIKKARLSESQKLFAEILRKIFLQPGAGRKEAALLRGMGDSVNKKLRQDILNKLLDEGLIKKVKGREGAVYVPIRSETGRVEKMLADLTLSNDPLWKKISALK